MQSNWMRVFSGHVVKLLIAQRFIAGSIHCRRYHRLMAPRSSAILWGHPGPSDPRLPRLAFRLAAISAFARSSNGGLIVTAVPIATVQRDLIITFGERKKGTAGASQRSPAISRNRGPSLIVRRPAHPQW